MEGGVVGEGGLSVSGEDSLPVAIARVESKLDHLLVRQDAIGKQVDAVEARLREVEQEANALKRTQEERVPWTAVISAVAAAVALGLVIAERLFSGS